MNKNKLAGSALIVVAALIGAAAFAQDAGLMPMRGHGFDIAAMDGDKDGKVTKAEAEAFQAARVKVADANGDGKLSADELVQMQIAAMSNGMAQHAAKLVAHFDADKDGFLSAAELAARPGPVAMFDRMDANADGAITQAEVDAGQKMQGKHGGHGKHGDKGGQGGPGCDGSGDMMDGADQGN